MIHLQRGSLVALIYILITTNPLFRERIWVKIDFLTLISPFSSGERNLNPRGDVDRQKNKEILVYSTKSKSKYKEKFTLNTLKESNPVMYLSNLESSFNPSNIEPSIDDLSIALKKQSLACRMILYLLDYMLLLLTLTG